MDETQGILVENITVTIPPSTSVGISTRAQQNAIDGRASPVTINHNNSHNWNGAQGRTSPSLASAKKGLRAKLMELIPLASDQDYEREFGHQPKIVLPAYDGKKAKDFMAAQKSGFGLRVFGFLEAKSSRIRIGYGLGKFDEGDEEISESQILFVGDRDEFNTTLAMFILPKDNSYKWTETKTNYDKEEFLTHCNDGDNKNKYRKGGTDSQKLPRVVYLPYNAALVINDNNGATYNLVLELVLLEGGATSKSAPQHTAFIKKWCIGAMAEGTISTISKLAITLTAITTPYQTFARFCQEKINHLLGNVTTPGAAKAPSPSSPGHVAVQQ